MKSRFLLLSMLLSFSAMMFGQTPNCSSSKPSAAITADDHECEVENADKDANAPQAEQEQQPVADPGFVINQADAFGMPAEKYKIRELGGAGSLRDHIGIANIGGIKITDAEFYQVYDSLSDGGNSTSTIASTLRTSLVYDRNFRKSRLSFQYQPRIAFVDGKYESDFSQQNLSFDTYRYLSQRWTVGITSQFAYFNSRDLTGQLPLSLDMVTGSTQQQQFLDGPSQQMSAETSISLSYEMDARNRISIQPNVNYYRYSKKDSATGNASTSFGTTIKWTHVLDRRKSIGAYYSLSRHHYENEFSNSMYHSIGIDYSQVLTPNWSYGVSVGASRAAGSIFPQWTWTGNGSLSRKFRKASAALSYSRDYLFPGYIDSSYHHRIGGLYNTMILHKMSLEFGFGYYRSNSEPKISGKYGTAQVSYKLFPHISWFANYAYKSQQGDGTQIFSGDRNYISSGLRWAPGVKGSHE